MTLPDYRGSNRLPDYRVNNDIPMSWEDQPNDSSLTSIFLAPFFGAVLLAIAGLVIVFGFMALDWLVPDFL